MSRLEKMSWYNLGIFGLVFLTFSILFLILYPEKSLIMSLQLSCSSIALLALVSLGPVFFRERTLEDGQTGTAKSRKRKRLLLVIIAVCGGICLWILMNYFRHMPISKRPEIWGIFLISAAFTTSAFFVYIYQKIQEKSLLSDEKYSLFELSIYGPNLDERDLKLTRRAARYGLSAFWIYYSVTTIGAWLWALHKKYHTVTIDKGIFLVFFALGIVIYIFVTSIATIVLCRKEA